MLNVIPIQFLALFAYLLLRLTIGIILLMFSVRITHTAFSMTTVTSFKPWLLAGVGIVSVLASSSLLLGFATQLGALFVVGLALLQLIRPSHTIYNFLPHPLFWFLLLMASVTIFITGAGALAFDLPI
jgi:hypothetical protein